MIQTEDIKLYRSFENSIYSTNGGLLTTYVLQSGSMGNIFKNVTDSERLSGSTTYVKVFWKIDNVDNTSLTNVFTYMSKYTIGADFITFFPGTQTDTQMNLTGTERLYGAAPLTVSASVGTNTLIITPEDASVKSIIQTGDDIIIIGPNSVTEKCKNVTVVENGAQLHITLQNPLVNSFVATANPSDPNSVAVASICYLPDVQCSISDPVVTSLNGVYNYQYYPINHNNKGGLEQTWTIKFNNSSQFSCRGNTVGYVGAGSIYNDFSPINTALGVPYFTLRKAGFNNGWKENDMVVFTTHPAATSIWLKRIIKAGTPSVSNLFELSLNGESA